MDGKFRCELFHAVVYCFRSVYSHKSNENICTVSLQIWHTTDIHLTALKSISNYSTYTYIDLPKPNAIAIGTHSNSLIVYSDSFFFEE